MTRPLPRIHLQRDLDQLTRAVQGLAQRVEDALDRALLALTERRLEVAHEVVEGDDAIDEDEVLLEEECLKVLALHQPVAGDLRYLVAVVKVIALLERVADLAASIASRAAYLAVHPPLLTPFPLDFRAMGDRVLDMVRASLDALFRRDADLARRVCLADEEVDRAHRRAVSALHQLMETSSGAVRRALQVSSVSRHLERVGDAAKDIARDVIFLVEGEIVRHRTPPPPAPPAGSGYAPEALRGCPPNEG